MIKNNQNEIVFQSNLKIKNKNYNLYLVFNKNNCILNIYDNFEISFNKNLKSKSDFLIYNIFKIDDKLFYKNIDDDYVHKFLKNSLNKIISKDYFRDYSYVFSFMIINEYEKEIIKFYNMIKKYIN